MRIAYLCSEYPAVSHTFILREVAAMRRLGVKIDTFTIRRTRSESLLAHADRTAFDSTFAILPPSWPKLVAAHLRLAMTRPRHYYSILRQALGLAPGGPRGMLWQFFYFVEAVLLWNECHRRGIRHIHVHFANVAADVALLAARIGNGKGTDGEWSWSFTMHGPTEFFDLRHYRLAEKVRDASFVVCISDFARSQLMGLSEPSAWSKLSVIHVGIPVAEFTPQGVDSPSMRRPRVLCVGRLVSEKGQAVLIEALAELLGRGIEAEVVFAGEGPQRASLEASARERGIDRCVEFRGAVGQDALRELYENAMIFCLPSFAEGVPVVLMEAMSMELPALSTKIAGIPELIDDRRSGLLVPPGRSEVLADAIEQLLTDEDLRRGLGSVGRQKVLAEFDSEASAKQLLGLFQDRLAPSPGESTGSGVSVRESAHAAAQTAGGLARKHLGARW